MKMLLVAKNGVSWYTHEWLAYGKNTEAERSCGQEFGVANIEWMKKYANQHGLLVGGKTDDSSLDMVVNTVDELGYTQLYVKKSCMDNALMKAFSKLDKNECLDDDNANDILHDWFGDCEENIIDKLKNYLENSGKSLDTLMHEHDDDHYVSEALYNNLHEVVGVYGIYSKEPGVVEIEHPAEAAEYLYERMQQYYTDQEARNSANCLG